MVSSGVPALAAPSTTAASNGHSRGESNGNGHSNGFAINGNGSSSLVDKDMATNGMLDSNKYRGEDGFVPLWEGSNFDRREFVRLALQAFQDMGYRFVVTHALICYTHDAEFCSVQGHCFDTSSGIRIYRRRSCCRFFPPEHSRR